MFPAKLEKKCLCRNSTDKIVCLFRQDYARQDKALCLSGRDYASGMADWRYSVGVMPKRLRKHLPK